VTDIRKSVTEEMDMDAIATMKPVHSVHASDDAGFSEPAMLESIANLLLFLASDMSMEISGAIIPIDHAWSTF
jgi:enoyl-[acyl-carrier-protein] reductase (NADH)